MRGGSGGPRDIGRDGKFIIKVLFYSHATHTRTDGDTWQNWAAACWTGNPASDGPVITHCELRFSDGYATSITVGANRVHYEQRLHTRENYTDVIEYHVDAPTEAKMQQEAQRLSQDPGVQFNQLGFLWNFVPVLRWWPVRRNLQHVFCSELVVFLLQIGGFLMRLDPATTSPMALFKAAQEDVTQGTAHWSWNREYGAVLNKPLIMK
jgi:hypothetical protein